MKSVRIDLTTEAYEMAIELAESAKSTVPTIVGRAANRLLELMANLGTSTNEIHAEDVDTDLDVVEVRSIDGKDVAGYNIRTGELSPPRRLGS